MTPEGRLTSWTTVDAGRNAADCGHLRMARMLSQPRHHEPHAHTDTSNTTRSHHVRKRSSPYGPSRTRMSAILRKPAVLSNWTQVARLAPCATAPIPGGALVQGLSMCWSWGPLQPQPVCACVISQPPEFDANAHADPRSPTPRKRCMLRGATRLMPTGSEHACLPNRAKLRKGAKPQQPTCHAVQPRWARIGPWVSLWPSMIKQAMGPWFGCNRSSSTSH